MRTEGKGYEAGFAASHGTRKIPAGRQFSQTALSSYLPTGNYLHKSRVLAKYAMRGYIKLERDRVGIATQEAAPLL